MRPTPVLFRRLLVAYFAAALLSIVLGEGSVSSILMLAYEAEPNYWMETYPKLVAALMIVYMAVACVGMVGLYRFRLWGRSIALWSTLVGFALVPFLGVKLASPLVQAVDQCIEMLWGGLLAMAYFSPVSAAFHDTPAAGRSAMPVQGAVD